jgi:hypothetical protein
VLGILVGVEDNVTLAGETSATVGNSTGIII